MLNLIARHVLIILLYSFSSKVCPFPNRETPPNLTNLISLEIKSEAIRNKSILTIISHSLLVRNLLNVEKRNAS